MAKMARERAVKERRVRKQEKKAAAAAAKAAAAEGMEGVGENEPSGEETSSDG
jgi:hypothetical protein